MAKELTVGLDPIQTGLTLTTQVLDQDGNEEVTAVVMTEVATSAYYTGDLDYTALPDGPYVLRTIDSGDSTMVATDDFVIVGGNRVDEDYLRKTINNSALQEH